MRRGVNSQSTQWWFRSRPGLKTHSAGNPGLAQAIFGSRRADFALSRGASALPLPTFPRCYCCSSFCHPELRHRRRRDLLLSLALPSPDPPITRVTHSKPPPQQPQHRRLSGTPAASGTAFATFAVALGVAMVLPQLIVNCLLLLFAVALAECWFSRPY